MFDHRVVPITLGPDGQVDLLELERTLKEEGRKGWELATVVPDQNLGDGVGRAHLLMLRRERTRDVFHGGEPRRWGD